MIGEGLGVQLRPLLALRLLPRLSIQLGRQRTKDGVVEERGRSAPHRIQSIENGPPVQSHIGIGQRGSRIFGQADGPALLPAMLLQDLSADHASFSYS